MAGDRHHPSELAGRVTSRFTGIAIVLTVVALGLQIWAIDAQSLGGDSAYHLLAGHQALRYGRNLVNLEHPPLVKMLVSLPLLAEDEPLAPPVTVDQAIHASAAIYNDPARLLRVTLRARLIALFCFVLPLAFGCWHLGARFGGARTGWILMLSIGLSFSVVPVIGTLQTDAAVTAWGVWSLVVGIGFVRRPGWGAAALLGLALGTAMASKFSGILLAPTAAAAITFAPDLRRRWRTRVGQLALVGGVAVALVHVVYAAANWRYDPGAGRAAITAYCADDGTLLVRDRLRPVEATLLAVERVDPLFAQYLTGLLGVRAQNAEGAYLSYAFGSVSKWGRWWYFPALLAAKAPLVLLAAAAAAAVSAARRRWRPRLPAAEWWLVIITVTIYLLMAVTSNYNLGFRHLLPILPLLALPIARWLSARPGTAVAVMVALAAESIAVGPHWMCATNTWWLSRANPTRFAFGAGNTEYRQNFISLARSAERRGIEKLGVLYPTLPPQVVRAYVPGGRMVLPGDPLPGGWYAVNVTVEQLVPAILAAPAGDLPNPAVKGAARDWLELWSRVRQGEDHGYIGGTFRLYRLDDDPAAILAR